MTVTASSEVEAHPPESPDVPPSRPQRRPWVRLLAWGIPILAVATVGAIVLSAMVPTAPNESAPPASGATVPVTAGDMVEQTNVTGAIAYARTAPITAGAGGVITELPAPGASIAAGGVLYKISATPVILLAGPLPAWRDFAPGMTDGDDVLQLEQNLAVFGLLTETPDTRFDWDTTSAIREWQRSLGLERTGIIERSSVLFWSGDFRVDSVSARLGQDVGPGSELYQATTPEKVVDLVVSSSDRELAVTGETVNVALPNGTTIEGIIQTVGAPFSKPKPSGDGTTVVVPVRIALSDQAAVADLALATVTVSFSSALRDDVLTVPVDALVPLDETHYAVELPEDKTGERQLVPIEVGASSAGRVEISGKGIAAGLLVVVPER